MWNSVIKKTKAIAAYSLLAVSVWQLFEIPHYIAAVQRSDDLASSHRVEVRWQLLKGDVF
ncbi:MAG: hypothetical protein ACFE0I_03575 [Elainellaceae cyanobacterium]